MGPPSKQLRVTAVGRMLLPLLREAKRVEPMHFAAGEKLGSLRGARVAVRANDVADHELLAPLEQRRPAAANSGDDGAVLPPPQYAGEDDRWFGAVVTRVDPSSLVVTEKEVDHPAAAMMGDAIARRGRASAVAADERVDGYSNLFSVEFDGSGAERRGVDGADLSWDLSKVGAARACVCSALARADCASVGGERAAARGCLGPRPGCDASKKRLWWKSHTYQRGAHCCVAILRLIVRIHMFQPRGNECSNNGMNETRRSLSPRDPPPPLLVVGSLPSATRSTRASSRRRSAATRSTRTPPRSARWSRRPGGSGSPSARTSTATRASTPSRPRRRSRAGSGSATSWWRSTARTRRSTHTPSSWPASPPPSSRAFQRCHRSIAAAAIPSEIAVT